MSRNFLSIILCVFVSVLEPILGGDSWPVHHSPGMSTHWHLLLCSIVIATIVLHWS